MKPYGAIASSSGIYRSYGSVAYRDIKPIFRESYQVRGSTLERERLTPATDTSAKNANVDLMRDGTATAASVPPYIAPASTTTIADASVAFAAMSPLSRLSYLASNRPLDLLAIIAGAIVGLILTSSAAFNLWPRIKSLVISPAYADSLHALGMSSSRDPFEWYIAGLMGITLLISLAIAIFAKTEKKISFGTDSAKIITGFAVGFLSGGPPRP